MWGAVRGGSCHLGRVLRKPVLVPPCVRDRWSEAAMAQRHFGRASKDKDLRKQTKNPEKPEEAGKTAAAAATAASEAADAGSSGASPSSTAAAKGPTNAPVLFALPLYRKPAFPGFYQIVQVSEQEVMDFLGSLKSQGSGEYLGAFMTKELPTRLSKDGGDLVVPETPQQQQGQSINVAQSLRRDAGCVKSASELEDIGTVVQVVNLIPYPNIAGGQVVIMPHKRVRRTRVVTAPSPNIPLPALAVDYLEEPVAPKDDELIRALNLEVVDSMKELIKISFLYKEQFEQVVRFYDLDDPRKLVDLVAGMSTAQRGDLQAILEEPTILGRLRKVKALVSKDVEFAKTQTQVKHQVEEKVSKEQRRLMLKEMMKQITKELGIEKDDKQQLIQQFRDALQGKTVPEDASKVIEAELTKLSALEPSSSEYNVCRSYLEWLTCLPWGQTTEENKNIAKAEKILNEDHYGLEDVKERILEHTAVSILRKSVQGKIMCMVGPPGVGKTSIGKSIARALDRKFFRFSVGGLHDVAEIRGHRRTYVGAMPGKLIQCLKLTQSSNPVILIDEIDKLGRDMRGDPSSALLEVLDPEQNSNFRDHYLDVPVDLSQVLFVCTANVSDTIPGPLMDRMEVIRIAGYVHEEKMSIAKQYLLPHTQEQSGVGPDNITVGDDVLNKMIKEYAREAGVRQLQKFLEKITRKVALSMVRTKPEERTNTLVTAEDLTKYIGQPIYVEEKMFPAGTPPGVVVGLAWTAMGGASLHIEARGRLPRHKMEQISSGDDSSEDGAKEPRGGGGGGGSMKVTGQVGSVMNESSEISLTYARLFAREIAPSNTFLSDAHIHLNVPQGAVPKDGPSAGVTMATSLLSLAFDRSVKTDLAMTGELTLSGKVLKVGGIKEKVIAAQREGIQTLVLPRQNEADFLEIKEYLRAGLTAHFVDHYDDVYELAFELGDAMPFLSHAPRGEARITVFTPVPAPEEQPEATPEPEFTSPVSSPAESPAAL
mmetsp:Transcript_69308/g.166170  ORF Transcript_69308/g.166170 Transcript_69308/m.166170 type:complete len:993 (+) Transcript_69308:77-3055(+)